MKIPLGSTQILPYSLLRKHDLGSAILYSPGHPNRYQNNQYWGAGYPQDIVCWGILRAGFDWGRHTGGFIGGQPSQQKAAHVQDFRRSPGSPDREGLLAHAENTTNPGGPTQRAPQRQAD
jgi:hypothetical protein